VSHAHREELIGGDVAVGIGAGLPDAARRASFRPPNDDGVRDAELCGCAFCLALKV
jgi:hypothetical protein